MYLIFDTETTGLPKRWNAPITDTDNWPRCIQIAWQLHDEMGNCIEHQDYLVKPDGFNIPYDAEKIHGISTELAEQEGIPLSEALEKFNLALSKTKFVVGQNVGFDINIMGAEFHRLAIANDLQTMPVLDTCTETTAGLCQIPGGRGGKFKLPTLTELHEYLFGKAFGEAHNATADVEATTRCFFELVRKQIFTTEELDVSPALHVIGSKEGRIIAYTRLFNAGEYFDNSSLGRVIVATDQRKFSYGHELIKESLKAIKKHYNTEKVTISAQLYLKKFYEKHGFVQTGDTYLEDGIPHIKMIRTMTFT